jgi:hypothetical protein
MDFVQRHGKHFPVEHPAAAVKWYLGTEIPYHIPIQCTRHLSPDDLGQHLTFPIPLPLRCHFAQIQDHCTITSPNFLDSQQTEIGNRARQHNEDGASEEVIASVPLGFQDTQWHH